MSCHVRNVQLPALQEEGSTNSTAPVHAATTATVVVAVVVVVLVGPESYRLNRLSEAQRDSPVRETFDAMTVISSWLSIHPILAHHLMPPVLCDLVIDYVTATHVVFTEASVLVGCSDSSVWPESWRRTVPRAPRVGALMGSIRLPSLNVLRPDARKWLCSHCGLVKSRCRSASLNLHQSDTPCPAQVHLRTVARDSWSLELITNGDFTLLPVVRT
jgi:hypothetical protein